MNKFGQPIATPRKKASLGYYQGGQGRDRRHIFAPVADSETTQTTHNREQICGLARWLHANVGLVRGAVADVARYSVGSGITPQSMAEPEIAEQYERFFKEWASICDVGDRLSFWQMQQLASMRIDVDGDVGFVLHSSAEGWPMLQMIEAHRIKNSWDDKQFKDGVKFNAQGRSVAFKIHEGEDKFRRINSKDFILLHEAERVNQRRGMSSLAHAVNHCRDIDDLVSYEKIGVKMAAAIGIAITSESGEADSGTSYIEDGFTAADTGGLALDTFQAGMVPRLRDGEKIESFGSNRPNPSFTGFIDYLVRDVACGLGIPIEFVWSPQGLVGTTQRFVLNKAQRRFETRQNLLIDRLCNRIWAWVIAKGIKRGDIPASDDWRRVKWQTPAKITVDVGREAQAHRDDIKAGLRTLQEDAGERGLDWLEVREQSQREAQDLLERAQSIADATGTTLEFAVSLLSSHSPNPPTNPEEVEAV